MKSVSVTIFDSDEMYGRRLAGYLSSKEGSPFLVELSTACGPERTALKRRPDLAIITSSLWEQYAFLGEKGLCLVLDEENAALEGGQPSVYKYQSARHIFDAALDLCLDGGSLRSNHHRDCRVFGLWHSDYDQVSSGLLWQYGPGLHQGLLMNLSPFDEGMPVSDEGTAMQGVSDLIFYLKQKKQHIGRKIEQFTVNVSEQEGQYAYMKRAASAYEIREVEPPEWQELIRELKEESSYAGIFLEFGCSLPPEALLTLCDGWVLFVTDRPGSKDRTKAFRELLTRMGAAGDMEEISISDDTGLRH